MTKARDLANAGTALTSVSATELGYLDGVTSAVQTQMDAKLATATASSTYAPSSTAVTLTGTQTLTNKTLTSPYEYGQQLNTAGGAMNIDILNGAFLLYTGVTTANFTLNFRGNSSTTLSSLIGVGVPVTVSIIVNNTTAYYPTAFTIDGSAPAIIKWSGGTAPSAGNANAYDAYSFTIWKYAATPSYAVFAAGPIKYA